MGRATALFALILFVGGCGSSDSYRIAVDSHGTKIVTGVFSPALLETDSSFLWYRENYAAFMPDSGSVAVIAADAKNIHFIVVGGTWCGDTKRELPKFFKTVSLAHIPDTNIVLYGVDRSKKSSDGFTEKYDIINVPTFILFANGKEIGRIVESEKRGIEFDLVDLLQTK